MGLTVITGPVVEPPLAVIVCVFVSVSGFDVGVVVSKMMRTLSVGSTILFTLNVTEFVVVYTAISIGDPFK